MRLIWLVLLFLGAFISNRVNAQVVFQITQVPSNTPVADSLFIAGTFNNWNPGNISYRFIKQSSGTWTISLPLSGPIQFKITRGNWSKVEGSANGQNISNRSFTVTAGQTINLQVQSWMDLNGSSSSTANAQVSILSPTFSMPQLGRNRKIWLYLPPDYASTQKRYPVVYMHDGQNLFDSQTSFSGEWQVDEALTSLQQIQGDYGAIVVGIENGGVNRIAEYSPWVNTQYGGGQGDLYLDFIFQTLKPYVDSNYRTLPGRLTTAMIGSSMGGLISFYGGYTRWLNVSKVGVLSPSFWFSSQSYSSVPQFSSLGPSRMYLSTGDQEGANQLSDVLRMRDTLLIRGFSSQDLFCKVVAGGTHSESTWKGEFPNCYRWLFQGMNLNTLSLTESIQIYPNPVRNSFRILGLGADTITYELYSVDGKLWQKGHLSSGEEISISNFSPGLYLLFVRQQNKEGVAKLVVQP